jgi:hypothetical protein
LHADDLARHDVANRFLLDPVARQLALQRGPLERNKQLHPGAEASPLDQVAIRDDANQGVRGIDHRKSAIVAIQEHPHGLGEWIVLP